MIGAVGRPVAVEGLRPILEASVLVLVGCGEERYKEVVDEF
jgi:hypothetical protein